MSESAVQLQQRLVARWREMDAQYRYNHKKRGRDESDDPKPRTLNVVGANTDGRPAHERQSTLAQPQNS